MLEAIIDFITQSPYLTIAVILVAIAIGLTILSGLIDIAIYIAVLSGIVLGILGAIHIFLPEYFPLTITAMSVLPALTVRKSVDE